MNVKTLKKKHNLATKPNESMWFDWNPYMNQEWWDFADTTFNPKQFAKLGSIISSIPEGFELQKPVTKLFEDRQKMNNGEAKINWGFAEIMAYATLLHEGYPVRLTGQDVRRGTFSHRHAVVHNKIDGNAEMPLLQIAQQSKTNLEIYDLRGNKVYNYTHTYEFSPLIVEDIYWNGNDLNNYPLPQGIYIYKLHVNNLVNGKKVTVHNKVFKKL